MRSVVTGCFLLAFLGGCPPAAPDPEQPEPGADLADRADGITSDAAGPDAGVPVCQPGEFFQCSGDFKAEVVCSEDGTELLTKKCLDDHGDSSLCHPDEKGCLGCTPGKKRCLTDDQLEICTDEGVFVPAEECSGELTGQVCVESEPGAACVKLCDLAVKWNTYMGCAFWAVDMDNILSQGQDGGISDSGAMQFSVVVSNPHERLPCTVTVTDSDGVVHNDSHERPIDQSPLGPGELRIYDLPRRDVNGSGCALPLAYKIETSVPATAYQFNPLDNVEKVYSNDASLLLPENVLDKWYVASTREQTFSTARGQVIVIGTQKQAADVKATVTSKILAGPGVPAMSPGDTVTCALREYEVLSLETDAAGADLTGSVIVATRNVAAFAGSECANAPNSARCIVQPGKEEGFCEWDGKTACEDGFDCLDFNTCCCDHIEDQLFPVKTWGTKYNCARSMPRNEEPDVWRVVAAQAGTVVQTIPPQANIPLLDTGEWYELEADGDFELLSSKPVLVTHFIACQDSPDPNVNGVPQPGDAGIGDPAMMYVVPAEQYRTDYVFLAPNAYALDYVTIVARTGAEVRLDGELFPMSELEPIGSGEYSVVRRLIQDGVHRVESDQPVGIEVYGYDDWVSYGYAGGLDLRDLKLVSGP